MEIGINDAARVKAFPLLRVIRAGAVEQLHQEGTRAVGKTAPPVAAPVGAVLEFGDGVDLKHSPTFATPVSQHACVGVQSQKCAAALWVDLKRTGNVSAVRAAQK